MDSLTAKNKIYRWFGKQQSFLLHTYLYRRAAPPFWAEDSFLKVATMCGTTSRIRSTSASVLNSSSDRRSAPREKDKGSPVADSTWLGSCDPDVQAEPEDAQIPSASSIKRSASPSTPSKHIWTLPGRRWILSPQSTLCGTHKSPSISLSRKARTCAAFALLECEIPRSAGCRA